MLAPDSDDLEYQSFWCFLAYGWLNLMLEAGAILPLTLILGSL